MTGGSSGKPGEAGRAQVVRRLHRGGPATRAALGAELGFNRSTVKTVVDALAAAELVDERASRERSGAGRPSLVVSLRAEAAVVAAVEVRTDVLRIAFVGLGGAVLARDERPLAGHDPHAVVAAVAAAVAGAAPRWVGMSVPGLVRMSDGLVRAAVDLGWTDVPLGALLEERLGLGTSLGNDAELGALAEQTRGAARGVRDAVFLLAGHCVGAGVISGGTPLRGSASSVAELGHMVVRAPGPPCHCGSEGCWETVVGTPALRRAVGLAEDASAEELADALAAPGAAERLREYADWLALGLANAVNLLGPGMIVLGEPLDRLPPQVIDEVGASVGRRSLVSRAGGAPVVVPAGLGGDACLLGAAELAFESVLPSL